MGWALGQYEKNFPNKNAADFLTELVMSTFGWSCSQRRQGDHELNPKITIDKDLNENFKFSKN